MLAKDGSGLTVKVARGLHDLSEMEGVKVFVNSTIVFHYLMDLEYIPISC